MTALRGPTRAFLAASAFSSFGNGLTFPVGALYLVRVRGLPVDAAAMFFVVMAIAGTLASLTLGRAMDRHGPRRFVAFGILSEAVGLATFACASSPIAVAVAAVAIGVGNGTFFTGLTPLLAGLESGATLDRAFSVRSWLINLGNSLGALLGGSLVAIAGEHALTTAYLVNASTSVVLAVTLATIPIAASAPSDPKEAEAPLVWTRNLVALAAGNALIILFGFAMFEAVIPYVFVRSNESAVPLAHALVGASTVSIVFGQLAASKWSEKRGKARVLIVQSAIWVVAAGIGLLAVGTAGTSLWALGVAYGVVFGMGECLYTAGLQPLVVRMVRPSQLGRFNGVLSASFSAALAAGPALGFALVAHVSPYAFWATVAIAMFASIALWAYVARAEEAREEGAPADDVRTDVGPSEEARSEAR